MTAVRTPMIATVGSALACLVAALLPWLRTGQATRSAFGLARSASVLGLFDGAPRRVCLALWYLLPFMVAATWTAAAAGRTKLAAAVGGIVGITSLAAGILVIVVVQPQPGPILAVGAGLAAMGSGVVLARGVVARGPSHG
ncbi:MAG: hypothetical protein ACRDJ1_04610 [Actinomycetota bacterium]